MFHNPLHAALWARDMFSLLQTPALWRLRCNALAKDISVHVNSLEQFFFKPIFFWRNWKESSIAKREYHRRSIFPQGPGRPSFCATQTDSNLTQTLDHFVSRMLIRAAAKTRKQAVNSTPQSQHILLLYWSVQGGISWGAHDSWKNFTRRTCVENVSQVGEIDLDTWVDGQIHTGYVRHHEWHSLDTSCEMLHQTWSQTFQLIKITRTHGLRVIRGQLASVTSNNDAVGTPQITAFALSTFYNAWKSLQVPASPCKFLHLFSFLRSPGTKALERFAVAPNFAATHWPPVIACISKKRKPGGN